MLRRPSNRRSIPRTDSVLVLSTASRLAVGLTYPLQWMLGLCFPGDKAARGVKLTTFLCFNMDVSSSGVMLPPVRLHSLVRN
jgi:hypothetical protein